MLEKFRATTEEDNRPEMQALPNTKGGDDVLTHAEVEQGIAKMRNGRACGLDKIPAELYKCCPECKQTLREILQKIWVTEEVPVTFARATFTMLYKHKGSPNDPTKYRCIGLLNHAYKVLSQCMLARLETETKGFLSEWQAGFRKKRGCRDNVLVLRTIYDDMLEQGKKLYVTFIDYKAAFDSISHKFLDEALRQAGASNKSRAMFRAMYKSASATVKVADVDGGTIMSNPFTIDRGVIQGDIVSPLYFILALELILKRHDNAAPLTVAKGVTFGGKRVHTLGYADDAALLDDNIQTATTRVTKISAGSKRDADMKISIPKTEVMHVQEQGRIPPATAAEARAVCKYACPNAEHGCDRVFFNMHGMKCHYGKCKWGNEYDVDKILEVSASGLKFKVRWLGYGPEYDTWEPRRNLHPDKVNEFLKANNLYDYEWRGPRCPNCDQPFSCKRGVKMHQRFHCQMAPDELQKFKGTKAAEKVKENKLEKQQQQRENVRCEGEKLKNVFRFKYLGSIFSADGDHKYDVRRRVGMAMARMGQLNQVFSSGISFKLKMRLYKSAICSLFTYGSEAWHLDEKTAAILNGANARCLSRITGRSIHEEASTRTRSYDLVGSIRKRRMKWLGHILRGENKRLVKLAVKVQKEVPREGDIFSDTPKHLTFDEIEALAQDRTRWRSLQPGTSLTTVNTTTTTTISDNKNKTITNDTRREITIATAIKNTTTTITKWTEILKPKATMKRARKQKKKKIKKRSWTNKERQAWARQHWEENYAKTNMLNVQSAIKAVFSSDSDISVDYSATDNYTDDTVDFIPTHHNIKKLLPSSANNPNQRQWTNAFKAADAAWAATNSNVTDDEVGNDTSNQTSNASRTATGPLVQDSAGKISESDVWTEPALIPDSPTLIEITDDEVWATAAVTCGTLTPSQLPMPKTSPGTPDKVMCISVTRAEPTPSPNTTLWAKTAEIPDTPPTIMGHQHGTYTTPTYMNTSIPISPISHLHTPNIYMNTTYAYLNDTLHIKQ